MIDAAQLENPNLAMLEIAVNALGDLCDSLVFIGGCATGLLVTSVRAQSIRATEDVDVVAKVATTSKLSSRLAGSSTTRHRKHRSAVGSGPVSRLTSCHLNPVC